MRRHPTSLTGRERWIAPCGTWIADAVRIEGASLPFRTIDLIHTNGGPKLRREFGERGITLTEQEIASLFGGVFINTNTAAAHRQYRRQQVNIEPVGVAHIFLIEDGV